MDERGGKPKVVPSELNKLSLTNQAVEGLGLLVHPNSGWLCGDYAYYIAQQAEPNFDFYWLCEPDVYFSYDSLGEFFSQFETNPADFLAPWFSERPNTWIWSKRAQVLSPQVFGCLFPLTRLSNRAIGHLHKERRKLSTQLRGDREAIKKWPNDESFVSTVLVRDGFRCENLGNTVELREELFSFAQPILIDSLMGKPHIHSVLHPVLSKSQFISKFWRVTVTRHKREGMEAWISNALNGCPEEMRDELRILFLEWFTEMLWGKAAPSDEQRRINELLRSLKKRPVNMGMEGQGSELHEVE
jgi:hypothetical protein